MLRKNMPLRPPYKSLPIHHSWPPSCKIQCDINYEVYKASLNNQTIHKPKNHMATRIVMEYLFPIECLTKLLQVNNLFSDSQNRTTVSLTEAGFLTQIWQVLAKYSGSNFWQQATRSELLFFASNMAAFLVSCNFTTCVFTVWLINYCQSVNACVCVCVCARARVRVLVFDENVCSAAGADNLGTKWN